MKCPICNVDLVMSDRQGVEIDYCPKCRGVWLDRGELDKIIEKTISGNASNYNNNETQNKKDNHYDNDHNQRGYFGGQKKKGGMLGEIFDF